MDLLRPQCTSLYLIFFALVSQFSFCNAVLDGFDFLKGEHNASSNEYTYELELVDLNYAEVTLSFVMQDSLLYMSSRGAQQLEKSWSTFVSDIALLSNSGTEIPFHQTKEGAWIVNGSIGQKVELSYKVNLDHEDYEWSSGIDGVAFKKPWGVFYTGRSLFIMNGKDRQGIKVNVNLNKNWNISTPWNANKGSENRFIVNDFTELTESMIFAGSHEEFTIRREGFELIFALGGPEIVKAKNDYRQMAEKVMDYYIDLMGGVPRPSTSNPFNKTLVIINSSDKADGEVIGNSISIVESDQTDTMSKLISRFIFAHELFHLWNGKSFFPSDDKSDWFKEGVTNYYTLKSLLSAGVLEETSFFSVLNTFFYSKYINDSAVGKMSVTEGSEKHDHWGLIYGGGLFIGISQDMIIRSSTGNKASLDTLMRLLFAKYSGTDKGYDLEEIQATLSELSGKDQTEFFNQYILGTSKIPVEFYLKLIGLSSEIEDSQLIISRRENENSLQKKMINGFMGMN